MHLMICVSGFSKVGKDEFCQRLVNSYGAIHTGLIDPAKRHLAEIYGFSESQLFGPSENRNQGDLRFPKPIFTEKEVKLIQISDSINLWGTLENLTGYPKENVDGKPYSIIRSGDPDYWLSPREALQKYGELLCTLYPDTLINNGLQTHSMLAEGPMGKYTYSRMRGLIPALDWIRPDPFITCFSDFRHWNEIKAAKRVKNSRVVLVRIKSKRVPVPPFLHKSETEQVTIPDEDFDFVIQNDGSVSELHSAAEYVVEQSMKCSSRLMESIFCV